MRRCILQVGEQRAFPSFVAAPATKQERDATISGERRQERVPMAIVASISQQIWDMKYRLKGPANGPIAGAPIDKTIEDTWRRIARAVAAPEAEPARWAERFYAAMADFRFLPAGRVIAGAGAERDVTLFNCFVMGSIPDDMGGIFAHLREAALTMQQGGGIGYDFSTLRPRGAYVKGVGADASGPLSFMDVWDAMCRTIMSAGYRRGAMMATLSCDHPDIEAFIEAKREPGRLRMFNLSVLVTDAFMKAVEEDAPWQLAFGGTVVKVLPARELWDKLMRATYAYAEPGVIFIDRINRRNNLWYCEEIHATNPCLTADNWVFTQEGPRQIGELVGQPFAAVADGKIWASDPRGFFVTGTRPTVVVGTHEGYKLRLTRDHRLRRVSRRSRWSVEWEWCAAGDLAAGDELLLHDHRAAPAWGDSAAAERDAAEGYLLGLLIGDGVLSQDKAILSAWPGRSVVNGGDERPGASGVMAAAPNAARHLPRRADFVGWMEVPGRGERRLSLGALRHLAADHGMRPRAKHITAAIEQRSHAFYRGFLRALFDADGSVQGDRLKGVSVRLAQSDRDDLQAVQRMLLRLGIASTIYANRRPAGHSRLPDGRGGTRLYPTRAQHELVVANENLARFAELIGFADTDKSARMATALAGYRRSLNREMFVAKVATVDDAGDAEVFDAAIPGLNAFDANGFWAHNCGEQPLPPYGACLLGSLNLARFVAEPFTPHAHLDTAALAQIVPDVVRLMDNIIDISRFPLPQQKAEAEQKRRIGLGVTGLADALIMCGVRYGSAEAVAAVDDWLGAIQRAAYLASAELAAEKGAFPLFDRDKYLAGETVAALDPEIRAAIARHGIRNALLTSVAPTGTISLFADNVSSGLEPVFSFRYTRNMLLPDGSRREEEVADYAYRLFRRLKGETAPLPDYFVDAQILSPADHVVMQAAVQRHIDSSISKTINLPADIAFDAFKDVYAQAYALGCKGCTTYRPNEVTGAVLQARPEAPAELPVVKPPPPRSAPRQAELPLPAPAAPVKPADVYEAGGVVYMTQPLSRPEALPGQTYKLRWPDSEHALYITLNDIIQADSNGQGRRRPFEIFINSKNTEHYAWTVALTRMISAVFRRGGDVSFVVEEMKAVFDPRGGAWIDGKYVPSLLAAIGDVIERHMIEIGFLPGKRRPEDAALMARIVNLDPAANPGGPPTLLGGRLRQCPKCGEAALIRLEGCDQCTSCDYSKCG
jgi:ribonucleoside-diphosphate reductase alpha chain